MRITFVCDAALLFQKNLCMSFGGNECYLYEVNFCAICLHAERERYVNSITV